MSRFEKSYAVFAILFAISLMTALILLPEMRQLSILLPASGVGLFVNVILMFIVFRDIFSRDRLTKGNKIAWTAILLLFWPAILLYLPMHGFRARA